MSIKKLGLLIMVVSTLSLSSIFSNGSNETQQETTSGNTVPTISFYVSNIETGKKINDYVMPIIEKKNNVKIQIISRTDGTGVELKTMAASGNLPDLFYVASPNACNSLINSNKIQPLNDIIIDKKVGDMVDLDKYVWPRKSDDGNVYVMKYDYPLAYTMFYNSKVFDKYGIKVPTNYDEFKSAVVELHKHNIIPLALFGAEPWPGVAFYDELVTRRDPKGITGLCEGKSEITDEAFVKAIEELEELSKLGFVSQSAASTNASQAIEYFKTGKAAMFANGAWFIKAIEEDSGLELLSNPLAVPGQEEATKYNFAGGSSQDTTGYAVNPKCENLDLAEQVLLDYVYYRAKWNVLKAGAPNVLKAEIQPETARTHQSEIFSTEIVKAKSTTGLPKTIADPNIQQAFYDNVNAVIVGAMTADEFTSEMQKVITKYR